MSKITLSEGSAPATPDAGKVAVFVDSADSNVKQIDDTGTITDLAGGGGVTDHGALTGLADDDHTQYLNETRHDALPSDNPHGVTATQVGLGNVPNVDATDRANHTGTQLASTVSDFQTQVSANTDVTANTAKVSADGSVTTHSDVGGAAPADGQVLTYVNANNQYEPQTPSAGGGGFNPSTTLRLFDEFFSGSEDSDEIGQLGWRSEMAGSGAESIRAPGTATNPGIFRISTGTAANARSSISLGTQLRQPFLVGGGVVDYETLIIFRSSDFSANEGFQFGLGDPVEGAGIDNDNGIYFEKLGADLNLFFVCRSAGVETRVDTGQALTDGLVLKLGYQVNAAGTSVQGIINGSNVGSAITTNIPSVPIGPFYKCDGGGVNTQLDIDYFLLTQTFTTAR